ncbi:hypothetical protein J8I87_43385 [Paraburkholderia sp. LEh10]|uniref:hypothetical protein n=1 Tax=Paraburkholderia sp. LEh10 TaxID=2821353 RepID=UPI001AE5FB08|nr:hypothetical protein [Paraburkholderia sp. LEh10]MBP0596308.1 hypothetical protein [Paraburkholderia sp. LEh10]
METQSCAPYRGFSIDLTVTSNNVISIDGKEYRYSVSWSVRSSGTHSTPIASLPAEVDFMTPDEAFSYGETRAQVFIDGCLVSERH